ncbi:FAD-dependent oxidoreductase [Pseudoalteromonas sp. APC 3358]|uniref:protoporphyrinogen/coproporphyrinogen oxidase n=1 Tax=unclassified Pseudoalteromonas TaxID=194690 RepID=UPI0025B6041E|nr:FAD-dependent oxidoreductase [Pseudoalteromonas sp. APC 3358]MDN3384140.1 FAD-dependent oxidoreductase [Pseudoalteromonas sp. APC 3358]
MTKVKYLILGGGVSGLAFANFVNSEDYLIIEKEPELGGYCRTIYQDGFVWDYAGHFFHFATDQLKNFFKNKIDDSKLVERTKVTKIFFDDELIDFPFQSNIHQLKKDKFQECLYDLYFRSDKESYNSFLDMLYSKFGKAITDYFLKPYNEKLYACDLNTLDVNAMGRFFPYANLDQVIKSFKKQSVESYNSSFLYPKEGARIFVDALAESVPTTKISLNETVQKICYEEKLVVTNKRTIAFDYLINSSPLKMFSKQLDVDRVNLLADDFSYNKVLVFNLGFDKKSPNQDTHWLYFPDKNINFYRVGFYDNILGSDKLSMYVEVGYSPEDDVDIETQLQLTIDNLKAVGIIDDHKLISHCSIVMDPAYVHVSDKSNSSKQEILEILSQKNIHSIGRYGDWKYCSIEDSMLDAINLASEIS